MRKLSRACVLMKIYDDAMNGKPIRKMEIMDYAGTTNQDSFSDYKNDFRYFLGAICKSDKYLWYSPYSNHYVLKDINFANELKEEKELYKASNTKDKNLKYNDYKRFFRSSKAGLAYLYQQGEISEELYVSHKLKVSDKHDTKAINCLCVYHYIIENKKITKHDIINMLNISNRTIDNVILEIKIHLSESGSTFRLAYSPKEKCYQMINIKDDDYKGYKYY